MAASPEQCGPTSRTGSTTAARRAPRRRALGSPSITRVALSCPIRRLDPPVSRRPATWAMRAPVLELAPLPSVRISGPLGQSRRAGQGLGRGEAGPGRQPARERGGEAFGGVGGDAGQGEEIGGLL